MKKEFLFAGIIYFITIFILLLAVYQFLENWDLRDSSILLAGVVIVLVALGWGYTLTTMILSTQKNMEDTLTNITKDIIHELNIPLSTIQANSSMLKKNMKDDKSLKRIQRIEDASLRLKKLYNELVYYIHKEMHVIEKETVHLASLLEERIEVFKEQERNTFLLDLSIDYTIVVDKIGFGQMIDNIITNAMKYSEKHSPITICQEGDELYIIDKGIGMSTSELVRVYERYFQSDKTQEGVGLGLALVKAYCDREGLKIKIESEKNTGTTVVLNVSKVHT